MNQNRKYLKSLFIIVFGVILKAGAQSSALDTADNLFTLGDYSRAIKKYEEIDQKDHYILLQIARAHKAKGTIGDALVYYEKAIDKNPESSITSLEYGKLLITIKKFAKADTIFTKLTTIHPDNPNFQYHLGVIKEHHQDTTAIENYKKTFKLDNSHQKSCYKIAKHFLARRVYDSVVAYANTGLSHYPQNVELISILGQNYYKMERFNKAIPYFLQLLELNQKNKFIYRMLATSYHKEYENLEALKYYKKWLVLDSKNPEVHMNIAQIQDGLQNYEEAEKHYSLAILLQEYPLDNEYLKLAMVCRHQQKWKDAINHAKKALKENPENHMAQYELAMFADAYYKDPKIKLSYYNKYLEKFGTEKKTYSDKNRKAFMKFFEKKITKRIKQLEEEVAKL